MAIVGARGGDDADAALVAGVGHCEGLWWRQITVEV
jgi:hypothetical protein